MRQADRNSPENHRDALLGVINKAITAVPAVRYALGIVGVAAAAALITIYFRSGATAAIVGTALLLIAMILLRVFAHLASLPSGNPSLTILALSLAWAFVLLFCGFGILTASCVFFDKPKPYPILVRNLISPMSGTDLKSAAPAAQAEANSQKISITQLTKLSSLPSIMKSANSSGLGPTELRNQLQSRGTLTIDGGNLVVGEIGESITGSLAVDVLRLINGGRIVTNGNTLKIQANRIEVSSGSINSFYPLDISPPDASPGAPGTRGANGGDLYVAATGSIDGVLKVNLSGENGGRGGAGAPGVPGAQGARGQNGVDGFLNCSSGGSNGAPGGPGEQGKPGAIGGDGGDGGRLYISKNLLNSTIDFVAAGGAPGSGGIGGAGGPGGAGGQGGSGSVHCGGGHGGDSGTSGLAGGAGPLGKLGNNGPAIQPF
jgi:hypothetical protein